MKTWEIMRELTENPNKKFRKDTWADGIWITIDEYGYLIDEDGELLGMPSINEEWEEVPREVTWQEALEAWINKERIEVWREGSLVYRSNPGYKLGASEKDKGYHFDRSDFTKGIWYIL
jgi:hypothetical protein